MTGTVCNAPEIRPEMKTPLLRRVMQVGSIIELHQEWHHIPGDPKTLAYLAGYFDGEGCITLCHNKKRQCGLKVAVVSLDRDSVNLLAFSLGGYVAQEIHKWKGESRVYYRWAANNRKAQVALRVLIPYLIAKRGRAIKACELQFGASGQRPTLQEKLRRIQFAEDGKTWRKQ